MSSEERRKSDSDSDARSSISSTIREIAVDVERDKNIDEIQKRYAAAQVAAAEANSRYSSASRRVEELSKELETQTALLKSQDEAVKHLSVENFALDEELISLRSQVTRLSSESKILRDTFERSSTVSTRTSNELSDARSEIAHLQQLLKQKDADLQAIAHSFSFRLGRKITSILRCLPGLKQR